ncbi:MAG TPA: hypothetical protein VFS00_14400, partial [Polyangiaceae bacterium]|nr:hypothetical protein [Polyangiaceae bacterium]
MLTPQPLADASGATLVGARALAGSDDRICALLDGGRVTCWKTFESEGNSGSGATGYFRPRPLETSPGVPLTGARAFSLDDFAVCALAEGGGAQCQAFDYATQTFLPPEPAERAPGVPLAGVAALGINCALVPGPASPPAPGEPTPLDGHEVYCWGENRAGQLGDGTTIAQAYAVRVDLSRPAPLGGATSLALGYGHNCALVAGGEIACWGENDAGSLGQGTTVDRPFPMPVAASNSARFAGAQAVALGEARGCVLRDEGKVSCWGANAQGQVGDGTTTDRPYPTPVELAPGVPLTGVTSLAVGYDYTCALSGAGTITCWGGNVFGQLGDGT